MRGTTTTLATIITFICLAPYCSWAAPYQRPTGDYASVYEEDPLDCCQEDAINLNHEEQDNQYGKPRMDNLLYIPFSEATIRDFGIHKYVINRNIRTLMTYHTDSHLINVIFSSINQSTTEISRLVMENHAEFDALSKNEFAANFLDFWCAYRLIQLGEFSTNNLDIIANMFKDSMGARDKWEL
jgi:hypothetical protein